MLIADPLVDKGRMCSIPPSVHRGLQSQDLMGGFATWKWNTMLHQSTRVSLPFFLGAFTDPICFADEIDDQDDSEGRLSLLSHPPKNVYTMPSDSHSHQMFMPEGPYTLLRRFLCSDIIVQSPSTAHRLCLIVSRWRWDEESLSRKIVSKHYPAAGLQLSIDLGQTQNRMTMSASSPLWRHWVLNVHQVRSP